MSIKRIILVMDYDDSDLPEETIARLHAAGEELSAQEPCSHDASLMADFAARLEDIVQLKRRARAVSNNDKGKESEDEE